MLLTLPEENECTSAKRQQDEEGKHGEKNLHRPSARLKTDPDRRFQIDRSKNDRKTPFT
jgi:hypothetical protein